MRKAILVCMVLLLSFTGCSKKKEEPSKGVSKPTKTWTYEEQKIKFEESSIYDLVIVFDTLSEDVRYLGIELQKEGVPLLLAYINEEYPEQNTIALWNHEWSDESECSSWIVHMSGYRNPNLSPQSEQCKLDLEPHYIEEIEAMDITDKQLTLFFLEYAKEYMDTHAYESK